MPQTALKKGRRCHHPLGLLSASSSQQQLHARLREERLQQAVTALPALAQVLALLLLWKQGSLLSQAVQGANHPELGWTGGLQAACRGAMLGVGPAAVLGPATGQQQAMQKRWRTWMEPELGGRVAQGAWR
jgi:hypothetical protein